MLKKLNVTNYPLMSISKRLFIITGTLMVLIQLGGIKQAQAACSASSLQNCYANCGGNNYCYVDCENKCNQGTLPDPTTPPVTPPPASPPPATPPPTSPPPTTPPPTSPTPEPGASPTPAATPEPGASPTPAPSSPPPGSPPPAADPGGGGNNCADPSNPKFYVENNCKAIEEGGENEKVEDVDDLARHLIFDGYQAYRGITGSISIHNYTNSRNALEVLNEAQLNEATIPFLRNDDYQHARLNSAENYYGYGANKMMGVANVASPSANDIIVESSALTLSLSAQVQCSFKLMNLYYIYETCEGGELAGGQTITGKNEKSCQGLYYTADGSEYIPLSAEQASKGADLSEGYKMKDLVTTIMQDKVGEVEGLKDPVTDRGRFCQELYSAGAKQRVERIKEDPENAQKPPEEEEEKAMTAIINLTFFLSQYRTGYIVQATRICPVEQNGMCTSSPGCAPPGPIYEHDFETSATCDSPQISSWGDCKWELLPDQVRVFPFKYPDLFSNKNFCNQWDEGYPDNCDDSWEKIDQYTQDGPIPEKIKASSGEVPRFSYTNTLTEYADPATQTWLMNWDNAFNARQRDVIQKGSGITVKRDNDDWTKNENKVYYDSSKMSRNTMADGVLDVDTDYIAGAPMEHQINCAEGFLNNHESCQEDSKYLELALIKIIHATVKNNTFAEYYLGERDGDNGVSPTFEISQYAPSVVENNTPTFRNIESKEIAAKMGNPVELAVGGDFYNDDCSCYELVCDPEGVCECVFTSGPYHPGAVARYWVVMPYGQELMMTEDNILGSIYPRHQGNHGKGYLEFVNDDKRQMKRMAVNNLRTPGGTSIALSIPGGGPISNIFTVQASLYSSQTPLYKILQSCKDINQYFLGECGSDEAPEDPNASPESEIPGSTMDDLQEQFPDIPAEELEDLAGVNPENPGGFIEQYQDALDEVKDNYPGLSPDTVKDVVKDYLDNSGGVLDQISGLKDQFGNLAGLDETAIKDLVKDYGGQAGDILGKYQEMLGKYGGSLNNATIMETIKKHLGDLDNVDGYLSQIQNLTGQFSDLNPTTIMSFVEQDPVNAGSMLSQYQDLIGRYSNLPQAYVQEFVQTNPSGAEGMIQQYLNLVNEHKSKINPSVLKDIIVANPGESGNIAADYLTLLDQYKNLDQEFLTGIITNYPLDQAQTLASQTQNLLNQHRGENQQNLLTVIAANPSDPTAAVDDYLNRATSAVATYGSYIDSGRLATKDVKRVVARRPADYTTILNQYLQGVLSRRDWNNIIY